MTAMTARQQKAALRHVIANMSVRQQKYVLRSETALWQRAAVGLFALSLTVNIGISGAHELDRQMWSAQEARYQAQVQQAEQAREQAVQELGTLRLRWSEEQEDRAAQVAAYENVAGYRYIGECTVTYYCPCEKCCGKWADGLTATGLPAGPGIVAVDKSVIPLGSTVVIDGQRYLAADTGVTGKHVDVCLAEHEATVAAGVRSAEVWYETD